MSTIKSSAEHLTLNADGASKDIKFQANGVEKASISSAGAFTSTTIDATALTGNLPAISGASLTGVLPLAGGTMTGNLIVSGASTPKITVKSNDGTSASIKLQRINEDDSSTDFELKNDGGTFKVIYDNNTNNEIATLQLTSDGRGLSQFTAKAWCFWKQTGTQAIRDSHNISSVVDRGVGWTDVNYNVDFANAEFCAVASIGYADADHDDDHMLGIKERMSVRDSGVSRFLVNLNTNGGAYTDGADVDRCSLITFGD